ncbi:MAG: hypothetical protein JNL97_03380 [Verrucomicrobiales bacterium]|nr:hypothetical protein [Verrucomicrobiales bacterium]
MNSFLLQRLVVAPDRFVVDFVVDALTRGSLVLLAAAALCRCGNRFAAADRHRIWALALATTAVLATAAAGTIPFPSAAYEAARPSSLIAPIGMTLEPEAIAGRNSAVSAGSPAVAAVPIRQTPPGSPAPSGAEFARADGGLRLGDSAATTIALLWACGTLVLLARFAFGHLRLARHVRDARPVEEPEWKSLLQDLVRALGMRRQVELRRSPRIPVPMTLGTWTPRILLPESSVHWSEDRRRAVLMHELGHIGRRDCLVHDLASIVGALLWFQPLAWLARHRMRLEREFACDDSVLGGGVRASDYAEHLVDLAGSSLPPVPAGAAAMAQVAHLTARVHAILDSKRPRVPRPPWVSVTVAAMLLATGAVVPPLRAVAPPAPDTDPGPESASPLFPIATTNSTAQVQNLELAIENQLKRVEALQRNLDRIRESRQLTDSVADGHVASSDLETAVLRVARVRDEVRSRLSKMVAKRDQLTRLDASALLNVLLTTESEDRLLQHLSITHANADVDWEATKATYGDTSAEARKALKVRDLLQTKLDDRVQGILHGLGVQIEAARAELDLLDAELGRAKKADSERAEGYREYFEAKRRVENERIMLDVLLRKKAQMLFDATVPRSSPDTNAPLRRH